MDERELENLLLTSKDPRYFLPGAYIQFLCIDGTELSDSIKASKQISGPLPDLLRTLDETLQEYLSVSSASTISSTGTQQPGYPIVALQELARNAILHRTYEGTHAPISIYWFLDRIEIHNPGGPVGLADYEHFGRQIPR